MRSYRWLVPCVLALVAFAPGARAQQVPLAASAIPQFVDPLPQLAVADGSAPLTLRMCEFKANVLSTGTFARGVKPETWVWGYRVGSCPTTTQNTYLGPVIVATRGTPTEVKFINNLGSTATSNVLAYTRSTDQTLHWADPLGDEANLCNEAIQMGQPPLPPCDLNYQGSIPAVVHLHGGEVPAKLDGGPDSWFTSDGTRKGHSYYTRNPGVDPGNGAVYRYPNTQEAASIWFHDHTLGVTRLNVYAGLAGGYLLVDPKNPPPANLPGPGQIIPLVIQDRTFDTAGQLYFHEGVPFIPNPEHPSWVPEFVGDVVLVNGKTWPYLNVEPKRYRFLFLNGSNARTYEMTLGSGQPFWQIGTDGGYLDKPVAVTRLVLMPGERADVIIDFAGLPPGTNVLLRNTAKTPYPNGGIAKGNTTGRIMQFRLVPLTAPDTSFNPATGAPLRAPMVRLVDPATGTLAPGVTVNKKRQLTLNEVMGMPVTVNGIVYPGGPLEILVNNTKLSGKSDRPYADFLPVVSLSGNTTYYSELPAEGDTEVWEVINLTADAHPIHFHLVQFQVINRQKFDVPKYNAAYFAAFPTSLFQPGFGPPLNYNVPNADGAIGGNPAITPFLKNGAAAPAPNEAGWKDTVTMYPGEVTRIAVRWAPTDLPANTPTALATFPFSPDGDHGYVWHCHIIDHEDNEMMRPTMVRPNPSAPRSFVLGFDY
jgi:FtsP/CotA-like multicopper oxidase with cupredoxin domain